MIRWWANGPRSLMRTTTWRWVLRQRTSTIVPNGNVRCAAVSLFKSKGSPLAVLWPCNSAPYQEASPRSWNLYPLGAVAQETSAEDIERTRKSFFTLAVSEAPGSCGLALPLLFTVEQMPLFGNGPRLAASQRCGPTSHSRYGICSVNTLWNIWVNFGMDTRE
jgi:hypothetical protein